MQDQQTTKRLLNRSMSNVEIWLAQYIAKEY